jgi:hypothetical protein
MLLALEKYIVSTYILCTYMLLELYQLKYSHKNYLKGNKLLNFVMLLLTVKTVVSSNINWYLI